MKNWKIISHCHDLRLSKYYEGKFYLHFSNVFQENSLSSMASPSPQTAASIPNVQALPENLAATWAPFVLPLPTNLYWKLQNTAQFQLNEKHPGILIFTWITTRQKVTWKFRIWAEMLNYYFICNQDASLEYILTFLCFGRWPISFVVIYPLLQRHAILWDIVSLWDT